MQTTNNIYIDALKFGDQQKAISFNELKEHLTKTGCDLTDDNYLKYIHYWFYRNFYHPTVLIIFEHGQSGSVFELLLKLNEYDTHKCPLTANAYEMLLDYNKLQQTRQEAKRARQLAIIAIWISVVLALLQIIF